MAKVMVFIDGTWLYSNLRHLAKESNHPGFHIDYGALPKSITSELSQRNGLGSLDVTRTFLFGSYPINYDLVDEDRARKRKDFFTMLREDYHYEVEAFPIDYADRRILHDDREADDPFSPREKCVDIALAASMLYYAAIPSGYDLAVAVVGDKDYFPLFQKVRQLGKQVAIVSIRQSCAKMYSDRQDPKKLKDFHIIWLNDMIERIAWAPVEMEVECRSPLHEGARLTTTTMRLRNGQPYFCEVCRSKFAEQKEEQMREYTSAGINSLAKEENGEEAAMYDGMVEALIPDRGFGFIKRADGASFFFHLTHLTNADWEAVGVGDSVKFTVTKNPVGAKAGAAGEVTLNQETEGPEISQL
ncbi:MAG: NYN domain-containing protein [Nitrospinota bacterium]|nr:NYN domain-containing protein [Nitrospinota bacterium]MDH5677505.1 NYN domain-containing protein [Nitrospinota bacterium]MDH5755601.1 NYN domain-containing protein [Nitrospinota bacterium]